jgi:hypothetical protein
VISPQGAPALQIHTTEAIALPLFAVFSDNFQTNTGWSVTNSITLTDGAWERATPAGGGVRGDPLTDSDGSGMCYVTDNAPGNSDVDGGSTILTSPLIDLSGVTGAVIEVDIWYDNDFGNNPGTEDFLVEISDNGGGAWTLLEAYNASPDVWVTRSYRLSDYPITLTSTMRIRFTAQDPPPGSVVEAGVDALRVLTCGSQVSLDPVCAAGTVGVTTPAGVENVLLINLQSGGAARRVDLPIGSAILLQMLLPALSSGTGQAPFVIFGRVGVPISTEATVLPLGIGTLCFSPTVLDPSNPALFILVDNLTSGPAALTSTPAPWTQLITGVPVAIQLTLQAIILEDPLTLRTSNGIILNVQ